MGGQRFVLPLGLRPAELELDFHFVGAQAPTAVFPVGAIAPLGRGRARCDLGLAHALLVEDRSRALVEVARSVALGLPCRSGCPRAPHLLYIILYIIYYIVSSIARRIQNL